MGAVQLEKIDFGTRIFLQHYLLSKVDCEYRSRCIYTRTDLGTEYLWEQQQIDHDSDEVIQDTEKAWKWRK